MNVFSCLLLLQQAGNMYFFSGAKLRRYFESRGVKRITCLWRLCYKAVLYVTDIFQHEEDSQYPHGDYNDIPEINCCILTDFEENDG